MGYLAGAEDFETRRALRLRTHRLIGEDEGCAGNDDRAHSNNKLLVDAGFLRHVGNVWIVRGWFAIDTNPFRTALVVPAIEGAKDVQAFDPDTSDRRASDFDAVAIDVNHSCPVPRQGSSRVRCLISPVSR